MSQIAEALAKAKERTGRGTPPLPEHAVPLSAESVERAARRRQRFWLLVFASAMPLTGFVLWTQLRSGSDPMLSASTHQASAAVAHNVENSAARGPEWPTATAHGDASAHATPPAVQNPQIAQFVAGLAISAVMPGDPARIMLAGRIVRAGDAIDGGLVFVGASEGQLRFTDAGGAIYTRRY